MAEGARLESVYTATYRGFESPPHRHIRDESSYESTGSFLLYSPLGGTRTPDRGSTTGAASWTDRERSKRAAPTKTPGAFLNNACVGPEGARPMDGPSNGEQSESIPPSPPYSRLKLVRKYGLFFACGTAALPGVGINASPGLPIPKAAPPASSPARRSAAGNSHRPHHQPVARPSAAPPGIPQPHHQ